MIQFLKQKSPVNIIILFLFGIAIKLPLFLHPQPPQATDNDENLYHVLVNWLNGFGSPGTLAAYIAFLFLFTQALLINYLVNEYRMMARQNDFTALAYLLVTSLLPEWNYLSSPLITCTLVLWCFALLFRLYNKQGGNSVVFNMGLLLGVCSYIYFPSASFLICFLMGLLILKPVRVNEVLLLLFGAITPYYFHAGWLFLTDQLTIKNFLPYVSVAVPQVKSTVYLAIAMILLALPFLVGGFFVQSNLHKMLIQVRKNWTILLLYLVLAFFVPFINSYTTFSNWVLLAAPFAAFHGAAYFYPQRNFFPTFVFLLMVGFIVFQQYFTPLWQQ